MKGEGGKAMAAINSMTKRPVLLALILLLATPLAQAMPGGGRFLQVRDGFRQNAPQRERQQAPDRQREQPQRFQRHDEGNAGEQERRQRFSPEERRQLRRDIHDAGRDIYRR